MSNGLILPLLIQSDRRINEHAPLQMTFNFLSQGSWRLPYVRPHNLPTYFFYKLHLPYKYDGHHSPDSYHSWDGHHGRDGRHGRNGHHGQDGHHG